MSPYKEVQKKAMRKHLAKKKHTPITHLQADDRTLCGKVIMWTFGLTDKEEPTCEVCLGILRRAK